MPAAARHLNQPAPAPMSELFARDRNLAALIHGFSDLTVVIAEDGSVRYASHGLEKHLGRRPDAFLGADFFSLFHPEDEPLARVVVLEPSSDAEDRLIMASRLQHAGGAWRFMELASANLLDDPNLEGLVVNLWDVTERKEYEGRLERMAYSDTLTGLPNRARFATVLQRACDRTARTGRGMAVMFIDLDRFKIVNDTLGHQAGDEVLKEAAARLRQSAPPEALVARYSGDEFAIILEQTNTNVDPREVAAAILRRIVAPIDLGVAEAHIGASIGVAHSGPGLLQPRDLLRAADTAAYRAKAQGRGQLVEYDAAIDALPMERIQQEAELRRAVEGFEFSIHLEPIFELCGNGPVAVDATAWWNHPTKGLLAPPTFRPLLEEIGLTAEVDLETLRRSALTFQRWRSVVPETSLMTLTTHVSQRLFNEPDFVEKVQEILATSGLPPADLRLSMDQAVLALNQNQWADKVLTLRLLGIKLALEQFGSGASPLGGLKHAPIDQVRADSTLIERLPHDSWDTAFLGAMVAVAEALRMDVVVQGIADAGQLAAVIEQGCRFGQGPFWGGALESEAALEWIRRKRYRRPSRNSDHR
ncbi:MAG: diguanylate cyclase [Dehalococcoidia bacterium]|nr:diguanylate cyclase [Dehalococcoidia bacterium]